MCDLKVYEADDLDCSNYCGTVDEECNSTFMNASCFDVGCTIDSAPQCTNLCRLNYSSCFPFDVSEMAFELNLQTDYKGWETSWEIRDDSKQIIQSTEYRNNASINEFYCLNRSACYTFELSDLGGDGLCCSEDNISGKYSILIDGSKIPNVDPTFGSSITHEFGGTCKSSSPSNKPSISTSPSLSPTSTMKPSITMSPTPDIQNVIVREFYENLGIVFDPTGNVCNYDGISCDEEDGRVFSINQCTFHPIIYMIVFKSSCISKRAYTFFFHHNQLINS